MDKRLEEKLFGKDKKNKKGGRTLPTKDDATKKLMDASGLYRDNSFPTKGDSHVKSKKNRA